VGPLPVTVAGPGGRLDLELPADLPLAELVGSLVRLLGGAGAGRGPDPARVPHPAATRADAGAAAWTLRSTAGVPLPMSLPLADSGTLQGAILWLVPPSTQIPRPGGVAPPPPRRPGGR
jgi:hypothetical protein